MTDLTSENLQQALDFRDAKTPALRLVAAIAYKNEITQSELAEWFEVERKTIYNWLKRHEEGDFEDAICDEHLAGRPRKSDEDPLDELRAIFQNPPIEESLEVPA